MKQTPIDFPDAGEMEVVRILLDFPILFRKSKPLRGWGCKRRRSNWNSPADNEHQSPVPNPPPSAVVPGDTEFPVRNRVKSGEGLSPVTPLSFFPSESDDKPSCAHSNKRNREELNRNVDELIKCKEMMVGKLESMMVYYNHHRAYNVKLKARKHELWSASKKQGEVCENLVGPNTSVVQQQKTYYYQCPMDQGLQKGPRQGLSDFQTGPGLVEHHRVGPIGILGLNVSAQFLGGPTQPLDLARRMEGDKKARYAEARRNRMIKNRLKKKIRRSGSRIITLPHRRH